MGDDYFALPNLALECDDPARIRAAVAETRARCQQCTLAGADKLGSEQLLARLPEIEVALLERMAQSRLEELQEWGKGA